MRGDAAALAVRVSSLLAVSCPAKQASPAARSSRACAGQKRCRNFGRVPAGRLWYFARGL